MSSYIPSLSETGDGLCACGKPATTEVQCGWHNAAHSGESSGGVYDQVCASCFEKSDEAAGHRRKHWSILKMVRDGQFVFADGLYYGPDGSCHDQQDHDRMMAELAWCNPDTIEAVDRS